MNLSQHELAQRLDISRNKIASYEGKGIEPKLNLLLKISSFFKISVDDLVRTPIDSIDTLYNLRNTYLNKDEEISSKSNKVQQNSSISDINDEAIQKFIEKNERLSKMIEGFRAFYRLRGLNDTDNQDINNLILILENVHNSNKSLISALQNHVL